MTSRASTPRRLPGDAECKVHREFRTSRRALNVLSVRAGLPEQAIKPRAHPGEHSGTSDPQVANNHERDF